MLQKSCSLDCSKLKLGSDNRLTLPHLHGFHCIWLKKAGNVKAMPFLGTIFKQNNEYQINIVVLYSCKHLRNV